MNPKLLSEVVIDSTNQTFAFALPPGTPQTVDIDAGRYDTILEVLANLKTKLQVVEATFDVQIALSSNKVGHIVISTSSVSWAADWANTDDALETLLGFGGTETVASYQLAAAKRHHHGWYSPVGVEYPSVRRRLMRAYQDTDDGDATAISSGSTHKYVDLLFDACLEGQLEPDEAGTMDNGYGHDDDWTDVTFIDFWVDVASKEFRYYPDAADGTVDVPGTRGTHYWKCVRTDEEIELEQLDPDGYTWFAARLPVKRIGG